MIEEHSMKRCIVCYQELRKCDKEDHINSIVLYFTLILAVGFMLGVLVGIYT